jgi:hypothetical protein
MSIGVTSSVGASGAVDWPSYRSRESSSGMIFKLQLASLVLLDLVRTYG